jgi:hypothetical protein
MGRRRLIPVGLLVAALIVGVVALVTGGKSTERLGGSELAQAADATIRAGGARVQMHMVMTVAGRTFPIDGSGLTDMSGNRGQVTMDMWPLGQAMPANQRGKRADWQVQTIYDYPLLYMRFPVMAKQLGGGKSWVRMDLEKAFEAAGLDSNLLNAENQNPAEQIKYLKAVGNNVAKVGTEKVAGVEATHYRGQIDVRNYPKLVPARERKRAEASVKRLIQLTGNTVSPVDVWVARDGLVRRIKSSYNQKSGGQTIRVEQTIEYRDFGTRIRIEKPPASEVQDITDQATKGLKQKQPGG